MELIKRKSWAEANPNPKKLKQSKCMKLELKKKLRRVQRGSSSVISKCSNSTSKSRSSQAKSKPTRRRKKMPKRAIVSQA